jgi:hypothetical protein
MICEGGEIRDQGSGIGDRGSGKRDACGGGWAEGLACRGGLVGKMPTLLEGNWTLRVDAGRDAAMSVLEEEEGLIDD